MGDLLRDHQIMEDARREAGAFLDRGAEAAPLVEHLRRVWEKRFGLVGVG